MAEETIRIKARIKESEVPMNAAFGETLALINTKYDVLKGKPQIQGVTLEGDKSFEELGLSTMTNSELEKILI